MADDNTALARDPRRAAMAEAAAAFIPRGARVLDLGCGDGALERFLPYGCACLPADAGDLVGDLASDIPEAAWDVAVALGLLERSPDALGLLRRLRARGRPVVAGYGAAGGGAALGRVNAFSAAELASLAAAAGFARVLIRQLDGGDLLVRMEPTAQPPRPEKTVWVLSYANSGNFGDRLGVHLIAQALPANACVRHIHHTSLPGPEEGAPDLLVVGLGNSLYRELLTDELAALVERAPLSVGIFGTQYREEIPRPRLEGLIERLHLWYARYEADALLYGRGRSNVRHFGDWLIDAFPMARPSRDEQLVIGTEATQDLPLDRFIAHIQSHRQVASTRLHPLLCALTSADQVAYAEQRESGGGIVSGKFRSMLIDVFGHEFPPQQFWRVDRTAVANYKARVSQNIGELRAELGRLLA